MAIKNGAEIEDVQNALDHAYISTTQSYIHEIEDLKDGPVMRQKF